jgi:hypothetical protein
VREEVVSERFAEILGRLSFGEEVLTWVTKALRESHVDEQREHEAAIARLKAEHDRLQHRLQAMYVDKLDGRIDNSFYVQMSEQWRLEQDKLMQEIIQHQVADRSYIDEGVRLIELAQGARRLFLKQEASEQRQLLNFVLSNTTVRLKVEQIQLVTDFKFFECVHHFGKCVRHRHFLEKGDGENLQQCVEGGFQGEALLDDGDQDVDGNRDPDLRLHGIVRRAVELFDPEMLLDPFEEQLDLPAALVGGLVGQKHQRLSGFWILEADAAQMIRIVLAGGVAINAMVWSAMMPVARSVGAE